MNPTPTTDTQRLRELLAAATPGPWKEEEGGSCDPRPAILIVPPDDIPAGQASDYLVEADFATIDNARLCAALRNEAPALLDEVSLHRASLASIRKAAKLDAGESIPMICAVIVDALAERDKLREEVERLKAIIEGSEMAFESVVEDKKDAEERCNELQSSLNEALKLVSKNNSERDSLRRENAESLMRNGQFRSDVTFAISGTREALTDDQIIETAKSVRRENEELRKQIDK